MAPGKNHVTAISTEIFKYVRIQPNFATDLCDVKRKEHLFKSHRSVAKFGWILTYLKISVEMAVTWFLPGAIQLDSFEVTVCRVPKNLVVEDAVAYHSSTTRVSPGQTNAIACNIAGSCYNMLSRVGQTNATLCNCSGQTHAIFACNNVAPFGQGVVVPNKHCCR